MHPNYTQHLYYVQSLCPAYRQFLLAPVGSWNYDCADEHSDVDTKAVILPSIQDVIENRCESHTHIFPNEEHCDVSDIRNFMKSLQKGNPQFIEVLFSNWIYPNSDFYGEQIHELMEHCEDIARCNPKNTVRAMLGMADRNYNLCKSRVEEDHANKWLYQLARIEEQMYKFIHDYSFADCLKTSQREKLLGIKNQHWKPEEIIAFAEGSIKRCAQYNDIAVMLDAPEDKWTQMFIYEVVKDVCKSSICEVD